LREKSALDYRGEADQGFRLALRQSGLPTQGPRSVDTTTSDHRMPTNFDIDRAPSPAEARPIYAPSPAEARPIY
jgi:hypothetical protein